MGTHFSITQLYVLSSGVGQSYEIRMLSNWKGATDLPESRRLLKVCLLAAGCVSVGKGTLFIYF